MALTNFEFQYLLNRKKNLLTFISYNVNTNSISLNEIGAVIPEIVSVKSITLNHVSIIRTLAYM